MQNRQARIYKTVRKATFAASQNKPDQVASTTFPVSLAPTSSSAKPCRFACVSRIHTRLVVLNWLACFCKGARTSQILRAGAKPMVSKASEYRAPWLSGSRKHEGISYTLFRHWSETLQNHPTTAGALQGRVGSRLLYVFRLVLLWASATNALWKCASCLCLLANSTRAHAGLGARLAHSHFPRWPKKSPNFDICH